MTHPAKCILFQFLILGLLELQFHGSQTRPQHEIRAGSLQPEGVLPRGAQTQPLHELRQHRGGRGHGGGQQRGHVLVNLCKYTTLYGCLAIYCNRVCYSSFYINLKSLRFEIH